MDNLKTMNKIIEKIRKHKALVIVLSVVVFISLIVFFLQTRRPQIIVDEQKEEEIKEEEVIIDEGAELIVPEYPLFEEVVENLSTSAKLVDYLNQNFINKSAEEVSVFSAKVLEYHGFEAIVLRYRYQRGIHTATLLRDGDLPKYITTTDTGIGIVAYGWSFEDFFQKEEERLGITIIDYARFLPGETNLIPKEWIKR